MFKKLRNKFLLINAITIIAVLICSFVAVFLITMNGVKNEIELEINRTLNRDEHQRNNNQNIKPPSFPNEIRMPRISFSVELDSHKNIIQIHNANFNNVSEEYIVKLIAKTRNHSGYLKYNDTYYVYRMIKYNQGYKMAFVDITSNVSMIVYFALSFLLVATIASVIIFFISRYFADKAISPIKANYEKQKTFISDASHELRTPLTIINSNIDLVLENKTKTIENQIKSLNYIKNEGNRMTTLVNNLLYLSKLENNNHKNLFERINLSNLVYDSILPMEAVIYDKNLKFNYQIDEDVYIKADHDQIKQLILIVLDNAIKYNKEKGKIELSLKKLNKETVLEVKNQGLGIDEYHLKRIFDRFYRPDESRTKITGGYGLGLAIAKQIVDENKAVVTINSEKNKETVVKVIFNLD